MQKLEINFLVHNSLIGDSMGGRQRTTILESISKEEGKEKEKEKKKK